MGVFDVAKRALLAGLGVQDSVRGLVDDLVKKGELSNAEGAKLLRDWMAKTEERAKEIEQSINDRVSKTLGTMNLATRDDLASLETQIQKLSALVRDAASRK